ncbi:FimV/HubP family polar landmark protein [Coxiella endosymbiont of Ornithodoros maritimus]|uniref:FimV/HubP family polar landmark protein n=1 Tax=Coxiella endosymbiont of Ornithodoros maritimus TaxID=1656172 RepID=UPI002264F904|nr:FimV/HubP family polar landmark protein [Coxiella endosymbiont of Ornithodoros maritimus]
MKRYLFFAIIFFIPMLSLAAVSEMNGSIPVQSFQKADNQTSPLSVTLPAASQAEGSAAKVVPELNENKSPDNTSQNQTPKNPAFTALRPASKKSAFETEIGPSTDDVSASANAVVSHDSSAIVQAELTQLNQNSLQFQQQTDGLLEQLNSQNQQLQQRLQSLEKVVTLLNQELIQLKQGSHPVSQLPRNPPSQSSFNGWILYLRQILGENGYRVAITGMLLALLLILWALWPRKRKNQKNRRVLDDQPAIGGADGAEYDYMGSAESIPAKINLARTYIAMEDPVSARKVLKQVSKQGNEEQRQEADELLKSLP